MSFWGNHFNIKGKECIPSGKDSEKEWIPALSVQ